MQLDKNTAVVDNDFTNHLVESYLTDERLVEVLNVVFNEMNLSAVMHPLVYEKELEQEKDRVKLLFDNNVICKAEFSDIFQGDSGRRAYYIQLVGNLYFLLMGEALPVQGGDVLTYWVRRKSLGEVHSFAMCLLCGCAIFLSDDEDAKILKRNLRRMTIGTVEVYSREEFINKHMAEGETKLNRKERQSLTHVRS